MIRLFFLTLITAALHAGLVNGVAILVKDEPITLLDIVEAMPEYGNDQQRTVDALIRQKLEAQEIKERGITVTKQEIHADVVKIAQQNGMKANQFYDSLYQMQKITPTDFKEKVRLKLLNQKLFAAIAFSHIEEPTKADIEEYYKLHVTEYEHASSYDVIVYVSASKESLENARINPMMVATDVQTQQQTLLYDKINANLARILEQTPDGSFTPIVTMNNRQYMFLVQKKGEMVKQPLDKLSVQISNEIMNSKRQQVINDYFSRLRLNADIKTIRMP
jgi:hypothetical protein